ncbi:MAG: GH92 family glycosyl hydrolase [Fluviicola sp.]|nr:GH92 family glycosyl hydrolase [Fluviicola sp.]
MRKIILSFYILSTSFLFGQGHNLVDFVNPFIGTGGHGHTYPGASAPFGFMQLSPDTRLDGWDGCGGYHHSDSVIYGFSHTHLSGTGVSDLGDVLLMPFSGKSTWNNGANGENGYNSSFSHEDEIANAGYYWVFLEKHGIEVELTTSEHCGMHHYYYSSKAERKIILDLEHRDLLLDADIEYLNDSTFVGKRISKAWAEEQHVYYVVQFSEKPINISHQKNEKGLKTKQIFEFGDKTNEIVVKIGVSAVDIDGAMNNLATEIPHWSFDQLRMECHDKWNKELSKIEIETENKTQKTNFYTALYHSYLAPNIFSDVDGRYRGTDLKIHSTQGKQYTVFSLWDTFRATHPLFTITQQQKTKEFIETFLNHYRDGGILPIWELNANYTRCMIGYHAIPVITDAYVKGIRDFDAELALEAMMHSAELDKLGLDAYKKKGFIGSQDESESVSKTLEYAYDDWCIAILADSLGKKDIAQRYYARSLFYKNLYNPESKFMQPKFNGGFKDDFRPDEVTFDYTEANSWQYSLFAPHDVDGLIELLGGKDELEKWLDRLFTTNSATTGRHQVDITGLIGQYAHGNEPSHHMAYLYNFTNNAAKGQGYIHRILSELYSNSPDGLSGNEDCGQMSSWYVLSAMGIYSLTPGSDKYMLGTPLFSSKINLENGKIFEIIANNVSDENYFVKSVQLNGEPLKRYYITHQELMNGGVLSFEMTNSLQKNFAPNPTQKVKVTQLIVPYLKNAKTSFKRKLKVEIVNPNKEGDVYYQLSGGEAQLYTKVIKIKKTTTLKSWVMSSSLKSLELVSQHTRINSKWDIVLNSEPHKQYQGESYQELIDQQLGGDDFRTGKWQGFYTDDMDVVIDFKKKTQVNEVAPRFLQDVNSWIWYPSEVVFYSSNDGKEWVEYDRVKNEFPTTEYGSFIQELSSKKAIKTRYIRVVAKNFGVCPEWHLGAGKTTFIFSDEIIIR